MASVPPNTGSSLHRNPVSYLGGVIVAAGTVLVAIALLMQLSPKSPGPYFGILTFIVFPGVILGGFVVVLLGMRLESMRRRRSGSTTALAYPRFDLNDARARRMFVAASIAFSGLFIFLVCAGYNGIAVTESVPFCGATCHVPMEPEATAYPHSPHARVACVECHVGGGAGAYFHSKINGVLQLAALVTNTYDRPIPTPIKGLRPARETCEACHWSEKRWGTQLYQRPHFRYDESSTPEQITMRLKTGGGEGDYGEGIHSHMATNNVVTFATEDEHLQEIPWVKVTHKDGSSVEYFRTERPLDPGAIAALPHRTMDCIDCHNRPAHNFETPDISIDRALLAKIISPALPWAKSIAVETLSKDYPSRQAAHDGMRAALTKFYVEKYPAVAKDRTVDIGQFADELSRIYDRTVFPDMKVNWKTYPSNIGHRNSAGCFRCHDGKHKTTDGRVLVSDCNLCHTEPERGPQTGMGEVMLTKEKDWHPWQMPEKHLAIPQHKEIQCYECHLAGRKPKTECNECHAR